MIRTNRIQHTWVLLKITMHYVLNHLSLLLFPALSTIMYLLCELLILYIVYKHWGIHILNKETLEYWGLISFWDFGTVTLVTALPFYFITLVSSIFSKFCTAHAIITEFTLNTMSVRASLKRAWLCAMSLVQYAYVSSLLLFVEESLLRRSFKRHIRNIGGKKFVHNVEMEHWLEDTFLVIPVLTYQTLSIEQTIEQSHSLMRKTFGRYIHANFSFFMLGLCALIPFGFGTMHIISTAYNQAAGIAAFFAVLGIVFNLMGFIESIFQTATYRYCTGESTGPYEHNVIQESFIAERF